VDTMATKNDRVRAQLGVAGFGGRSFSIINKQPNGGVDAAARNYVTRKLSMTSPLVRLASNDGLFGLALATTTHCSPTRPAAPTLTRASPASVSVTANPARSGPRYRC